jgi:hypothetical protein
MKQAKVCGAKGLCYLAVIFNQPEMGGVDDNCKAI